LVTPFLLSIGLGVGFEEMEKIKKIKIKGIA
jgi:hypothetical protein